MAIPPRLAATTPSGIVPIGINDRGQIVGYSASDLTVTAVSGFLLDRARFTAINRPGATLTALFAINDRDQIVGGAGNPEDQTSPEPTDTPMGRMA